MSPAFFFLVCPGWNVSIPCNRFLMPDATPIRCKLVNRRTKVTPNHGFHDNRRLTPPCQSKFCPVNVVITALNIALDVHIKQFIVSAVPNFSCKRRRTTVFVSIGVPMRRQKPLNSYIGVFLALFLQSQLFEQGLQHTSLIVLSPAPSKHRF